jgi:hypothetical protein
LLCVTQRGISASTMVDMDCLALRCLALDRQERSLD